MGLDVAIDGAASTARTRTAPILFAIQAMTMVCRINILLLKVSQLLQDVHARYRTSAHDTVVARFNERFILSLGSCDDCLVLDDELNVLPISRGKDIRPVEEERGKGKEASELKDLKDNLEDTKPVGDLVKLAKTIDQAQAILTFVDAIAEKTLSSTVTLTAGRGRGKSAALGLAIAAAIAHGNVACWRIHSHQSPRFACNFSGVTPQKISVAA